MAEKLAKNARTSARRIFNSSKETIDEAISNKEQSKLVLEIHLGRLTRTYQDLVQRNNEYLACLDDETSLEYTRASDQYLQEIIKEYNTTLTNYARYFETLSAAKQEKEMKPSLPPSSPVNNRQPTVRRKTIEVKPFSNKEYLTYPEFYEIGLEIFEGRQKMDDSELDKEPVVLSIFGERNRNIYMDGENHAELMASGFNASYLLGMARVVADCKTPQQFAVAASLGTCTATSGCLSHFPAREQYAIFDTRTMKRLFDGRTTYVVWPFSRYDAEKPFTREDKARTVLRHSMDTFFFAALRQARYHQARNVFLAGELGDCMETVQHAVMTFFPMLDKFHKGERLNVFIIKPASYISAIGALISHDS